MLGSGSSDAIDHYNIGTDMENVGGNYTKLGIKWHTGISKITIISCVI